MQFFPGASEATVGKISFKIKKNEMLEIKKCDFSKM